MPGSVAAACSTAASRMACARLPNRVLHVTCLTKFRTRKPSTRSDRLVELQGIHRHNLHGVDARIPLGVLTAVTGISGSGKSSLIAQALPELVLLHLGHEPEDDAAESATSEGPAVVEATGGHLAGDVDAIQRLVQVDQKPIGRTPRSNLATYTGLFDHVRKLFAATPDARRRRYDAGRFSFNVAKGAARLARAKVSLAWNCCSCLACTRRARPAMARATTRPR